ncbi:hypothetical protein DC3_23770 [Deinococcus cellulosilyticus NBRC 106333 = KACC 11606]|uniref:Uncharacterized protein n=1 Tax=Deinococcus cellulosilyticus (strain DSM 18568 / NBRC 106333 / KACC 11606 / 5516J-15) TaxID=1223518 RepID=A0A511N1K7_DEIC1|nr:hypothetical protein DC3_23770 [Deinococcus cellulosilyticus NBRC 106333 = KACC 11606]
MLKKLSGWDEQEINRAKSQSTEPTDALQESVPVIALPRKQVDWWMSGRPVQAQSPEAASAILTPLMGIRQTRRITMHSRKYTT